MIEKRCMSKPNDLEFDFLNFRVLANKIGMFIVLEMYFFTLIILHKCKMLVFINSICFDSDNIESNEDDSDKDPNFNPSSAYIVDGRFIQN